MSASVDRVLPAPTKPWFWVIVAVAGVMVGGAGVAWTVFLKVWNETNNKPTDLKAGEKAKVHGEFAVYGSFLKSNWDLEKSGEEKGESNAALTPSVTKGQSDTPNVQRPADGVPTPTTPVAVVPSPVPSDVRVLPAPAAAYVPQVQPVNAHDIDNPRPYDERAGR